MRLLTSAATVLLLITVPAILESCCLSTCGCGANDGGPPHYDFEAMTMKLYSRTNYAELPPGATTLSEVKFSVDIDATYTSMIESRNGGSVAYACSPAPEIANQQITSIIITSNHDMVASPATIFAGQDLSILFEIETEDNFGDIADILNKTFYGRRLAFTSDAELDSQQTHIFTFRITLSNGEVFEMVTRELEMTAG